jgi:hypothetical protein
LFLFYQEKRKEENERKGRKKYLLGFLAHPACYKVIVTEHTDPETSSG